MSLRLVAAGIGAVALCGCQQAERSEAAAVRANAPLVQEATPKGSGTAYEEAKRLLPMAQAIAAEDEPSPKIRRAPSYQPYALKTLAGGEVNGKSFEAEVMCRSNVEYALDALKNLVILNTKPGLTSFLGVSEGRNVEIAVVSDDNTHIPIFLMMGQDVIVSCDA